MGIQSKYVGVDPKLCTGCSICELICSFTKFRRFNPKESLIRINYNYELGYLEGFKVCTQCGLCINSCPTGAIYRGDGGIILIDYSKCIGCLSCVNTCPNNAIVVVDGKPYKCDLCSGNPQCVRYCVRGALNVS